MRTFFCLLFFSTAIFGEDKSLSENSFYQRWEQSFPLENSSSTSTSSSELAPVSRGLPEEKIFIPSGKSNLQTASKTVFLTILARNKEAFLPRYLKSIENLEYDKKKITIYINTNNNQDGTEELLASWAKEYENEYNEIIFERHHVDNMPKSNPHHWFPDRLKILGEIRNRSLEVAKSSGCDYYFVVDCDVFLTPSTLKILVEKDKPIIAPFLYDIPERNDFFINSWFAVDERGYFREHPMQWELYFQKTRGTFEAALVHCAYLIQSEFLERLSYVDGTGDYEFIIFSRFARENGVGQYICNEEDFGVQFAFFDKIGLDEEVRRVKPFLAIP